MIADVYRPQRRPVRRAFLADRRHGPIRRVTVGLEPSRADGSVDLAQLPAPGSARQNLARSDEYLPPRDELESKLVAVWEDVLGVRPIGVRTSFFKLGGYSLMIDRKSVV